MVAIVRAGTINAMEVMHMDSAKIMVATKAGTLQVVVVVVDMRIIAVDISNGHTTITKEVAAPITITMAVMANVTKWCNGVKMCRQMDEKIEPFASTTHE